MTNYAQWRTREHFEAIFSNPDVRPHMEEAAMLAIGFEPHLYRVKFSHGPA
ncbi:MAG: hypothetical protein ACR2LY_02325 [Thermoleophilaceae bacterium]